MQMLQCSPIFTILVCRGPHAEQCTLYFSILFQYYSTYTVNTACQDCRAHAPHRSVCNFNITFCVTEVDLQTAAL